MPRRRQASKAHRAIWLLMKQRPWWMLYLDDDRIIADIQMELYCIGLGVSQQELALSADLQQYFRQAGDRLHAGEVISRDEMQDAVNAIADRHGCEFGIPLPAVGDHRDLGRNHLVMARGVPMRGIIDSNEYMIRHRMRNEAEMDIYDRYKLRTVNSWYRFNHEYTCIVEAENGARAYWPERMEGTHFRKLIETMGVRMDSALTVEAEEKAQKSLKAKIGENQWRCYMLNDLFIERSPRSDLHYVFRKGYPTLVLSFHGCKTARCIAALCLHPMGFFQYTHAGLMTPTDEVICHLLMMRADEHKFWAKSGQWHVLDTRSGL